MGVHGLWELLAPVGRRVNVETLAGKKLAIDASIWMVQFMKAMRDEKGEMVKNAHLLGFFRRICKLLFLRTKPVFVFDGATPALKRRTVIARRRQRENAKAKIRKTAEKLLLNHLKTMRLNELAKDLQSQRQKNDAKGKKAITDEGESASKTTGGNNKVPISCSQEELDEMLAASLAADAKGKKVCTDQGDFASNGEGGHNHASFSYNQEELDEMLAASLAAEEDERFRGDASISGAGIPAEGDDDDDDEEMMLPTMSGNVDPAVLAALPPSMQLDLLGQMRERLMAENRQKYQKVKKAPAKFSELQIQSYLKTVAFRREIGEVQKAAAGKGVGGVQTSRIASEANREFIFSSSFTGDKQVLTSAGVERNGGKLHQTSSTVSKSMDNVASTKSAAETVTVADDSSRVFDDSIETYLDERGRLRVSRVRALGIRMTRDLQRNLELMKEVDDLDRVNSGLADCEGILSKNGSDNSRLTDKNQPKEPHQDGDKLLHLNDSNSLSGSTNLIEISFQDDGSPLDGDDKLFADLVAGNPVMISKAADSAKHFSHSDSDFDWEEVSGDKSDIHHTSKKENDFLLSEGDNNIESDVEWEDGDVNVPTNASGSLDELSKVTTSKGALEEEADFHEAIRRSLGDFNGQKPMDVSVVDGKGEERSLTAHGVMRDGFVCEENNKVEPDICLSKNVLDRDHLSYEAVNGIERQDNDLVLNLLNTDDNSGAGGVISSVTVNPHEMEGSVEKSLEADHNFHSEPLCHGHGTRAAGNVHVDTECQELQTCNGKLLVTPNSSSELLKFANSSTGVAQISVSVSSEMLHDIPADAQQQECHSAVNYHITEKTEQSTGQESTANRDGEKSYRDIIRPRAEEKKESTSIYEHRVPIEVTESSSELLKFADSSTGMAQISVSVSSEMPHDILADAQQQECHSAVSYHITEKTEQSTGQESTDNRDGEKNYHDIIRPRAEEKEESTSIYEDRVPIEVTEASLEEEMLDLSQERMDLGSEQRKLERNAESVSGEMFAECQELLQMFGLPYIIAPMEAEAQCAFMELTNLVDGVVTDDSDVFLFGARSVYKNIFDERKYVETYFMKDIETELGLSREKLIRMALLLGSDYTEGVSGIGIVNAIEVVNAFPEEDGLSKFREWIESPDPTILGKLDVRTESTSRNKESRVSSSAEGKLAKNQSDSRSVGYVDEVKQVFMDTHRNVSKNWHIPNTFPSEAVINAYVSPQVDKSTDPFSWGKPDLFVLRKLCWEKFAWSTQKADELLQPVLKEYNKHETQLRLEAFYTFNERFAKIRSKRINKALKGITGNKSSELDEDTVQEASKSGRKRRVNTSKHADDTSEKLPSGTEDCSIRVDSNSKQKPKAKYSRKRKQAEPELAESRNPEQASRGKTNRGRSGRAGRGIGRGGAVGRGKRKRNTDIVYGGTSSDATANSGSDEQVENFERVDGVRKSNRSRKSVKYTLEDSDNDDLGKEDDSHKEAVQEEPVDDLDIVGDAAVGALEKNQHKIRATSRAEGSSEDYFKSGGGFCGDEPEPEIEEGQPSSGQNEDFASGHIENNQHQIGDLSHVEFSSDEYLKMGGGFCEDEPEAEVEVGRPSSGQDGDSFPEAEFSEEYLNMGGGFCMDEDDSNKEPDKGVASPARVSNFTIVGADLDVENYPDSIQVGKKREALVSDHNLPQSTPLPSEDPSDSPVSYPRVPTKDDSSSKSLSAMPYLRRKRRKS